MFNQTTNPLAGLVKVILVLMALGIVVGLALSGTDLTNFITNSAKAQAINQQTQQQAAQAQLDISNQQKAQESERIAKEKQDELNLKAQEDKLKTQAKQDELALQAQNDQRIAQAKQNEQKLQFQQDQHGLDMQQGQQDLQIQAAKASTENEISQIVSTILAGAGAFFIGCLGIGSIILISRIKRTPIVVQSAQIKQADPWDDPDWRNNKIQLARYNEKALRTGNLRTIDIPASHPSILADRSIPWRRLDQAAKK